MARVVPTEGDTDIHDGTLGVVTHTAVAASNDDKVDATTHQEAQCTAPETQAGDLRDRQSLPTSESLHHDDSGKYPSQAAAGEDNTQLSAAKEPTTMIVLGKSEKIRREADSDTTAVVLGPEPQLKLTSKVAAFGEDERAQQSQPVGGQADGVVSKVPKMGEDSLQVSDMDKHSGVTTFSLAHPYTDRSAPKSDSAQVNIAEVDNDIIGKNNTRASTQPSGDQSQEDSEEESEHRGFQAIARRGTRRFIPRHSDNNGPASSSTINGKRSPFRVPQTMFMGHPVGSTAAEFLERQKHRVQDVRSGRERACRLVKLVMEHNAATTGSPLPDIDVVFPVNRFDHNQGDRCV